MRIFGAEFVTGASVLSILAIGQSVNVITGPAGNVLMMCGHERVVRNVLLASAMICLIANLILIPRMGAVGAAMANSATVTFENLTMVVLVWRKFGIMTIPMPQRLRNMLGATG
jgi:O-antigen/teichoic acid export membrane protein